MSRLPSPWPIQETRLAKWGHIIGVVVLLLACAGPAPHPGSKAKVVKKVTLAIDLEPDRITPIPATGDRYQVRPGDTLWAIASAHNVDVEQIAAWNNITKSSQLLVGQWIRIRPPMLPEKKVPSSSIKPGRQPKSAKTIGLVMEKNLKPVLPPYPTRAEPSSRSPSQEEEQIAGEPLQAPLLIPAKPLGLHAPRQWLWPHSGRMIARFGQFGPRRNTGIDIAVNQGDPVLAAADGVVAYADLGVTGYGNMILLRHGGSYMTAYAHLQTFQVKRGQAVRAGEIIALAGQSGITTSPRLHFEIRRSISPLNPLKYLPKRQ